MSGMTDFRSTFAKYWALAFRTFDDLRHCVATPVLMSPKLNDLMSQNMTKVGGGHTA
jgi:hypothetical protein